MLSFARLGTGVAVAIVALPLTFEEFVDRYTWLVILSVCLADVIDIGNTIALCYWLSRAKSDVYVKR